MVRTIAWYAYFWLSLVLTIPTFVVVNRLSQKGKTQERNDLVHVTTANWARSLLNLAGARVTVIGAENLPVDRTVLFVSNHQGSFDIPLLIGCIDKPKAFIAKVELLKMPLINKWMKLMNCVFLDRKDMRQSVRAMNQALEYLKEGYSMVVFPEGTRSKGKTMGEFRAGSLRVAVKAKVPIVPVTIRGSYKLLEQNGFFIKPADIEIVIAEPIETALLSKEQVIGLQEQTCSVIASQL